MQASRTTLTSKQSKESKEVSNESKIKESISSKNKKLEHIVLTSHFAANWKNIDEETNEPQVCLCALHQCAIPQAGHTNLGQFRQVYALSFPLAKPKNHLISLTEPYPSKCTFICALTMTSQAVQSVEI
jgi:hypothetical protein